jgi:hypothetical protein
MPPSAMDPLRVHREHALRAYAEIQNDWDVPHSCAHAVKECTTDKSLAVKKRIETLRTRRVGVVYLNYFKLIVLLQKFENVGTISWNDQGLCHGYSFFLYIEPLYSWYLLPDVLPASQVLSTLHVFSGTDQEKTREIVYIACCNIFSVGVELLFLLKKPKVYQHWKSRYTWKTVCVIYKYHDVSQYIEMIGAGRYVKCIQVKIGYVSRETQFACWNFVLYGTGGLWNVFRLQHSHRAIFDRNFNDLRE